MDKKLLQQRLDEVRQQYNLPALALSVAKDGWEFTLVSGVRNANAPDPVTPQDTFHFGSVGKSVTAALVHTLAGEGFFKLSTTLKEALPGLDIAPAWRDITIEQLLTHTTGLPANYPDMEALHKLASTRTPAGTRKAMMQEILAQEPGTPPSREHSYGNVNYILLGTIAEQATGKDFETLAKERVFDKYNMTSAGFGPPQGSQPAGHLYRDDGSLMPIALDNPPAYAPAGTMHASLPDWMAFAKSRLALLPRTGAPRADGKTEYTDIALVKNEDRYGHDGSNTLNYARVALLPEQDAVFIIASNIGMAAQPAINAMAEEVLKQILPMPPKPAATDNPSP